MFIDVWASAVVTALLGTLPGRSFRFRVLLVASFVTVSALVAAYVPEIWVRPFFDEYGLPEGFTNGEWAILGLYLAVAVQTLLWVFTIALAYWLWHRLLPPGEKDNNNRKLLVIASVVLLLLIPFGFVTMSLMPVL